MDGIRAEVLILIFRKFRNYSEIEDNWKKQLCKCQKLGDGRRLDGQRFLELAQRANQGAGVNIEAWKILPFPDTLMIRNQAIRYQDNVDHEGYVMPIKLNGKFNAARKIKVWPVGGWSSNYISVVIHEDIQG